MDTNNTCLPNPVGGDVAIEPIPPHNQPQETCASKSPKVSTISRQQSRIGGLVSGFPSTPKKSRRKNDLQMTEKEKEALMHTKTFLSIHQDIKARQKRQKLNAEKEKMERSKVEMEDAEIEQQHYIDKAKAIICNSQGRITTTHKHIIA